MKLVSFSIHKVSNFLKKYNLFPCYFKEITYFHGKLSYLKNQ